MSRNPLVISMVGTSTALAGLLAGAAGAPRWITGIGGIFAISCGLVAATHDSLCVSAREICSDDPTRDHLRCCWIDDSDVLH